MILSGLQEEDSLKNSFVVMNFYLYLFIYLLIYSFIYMYFMLIWQQNKVTTGKLISKSLGLQYTA